MRRAVARISGFVLIGALCAACGDDGGSPAPDGSTDGDADTDTDADSDADAGADGGCVHPDVVEECADGWCTIPSGCFIMGSPEDELGREGDEVQHMVTLTVDFAMGQHEVTQAEFEAVLGLNPSGCAACGGDCPVETVSVYDALDYANALSELEGLTPCYVLPVTSPTIELNGVSRPQDCEGYRLPTESEWEYAARAGSTTAFYQSEGNDGTIAYTDCMLDSNLDKIGWYCGNISWACPMPVESKAPNGWGLYDMSGNVWEWVWDHYGDYPGTAVDPTGSTGGARTARGGFWGYEAGECRSASRGVYGAIADPGTYIGFRLARSL